MTREEFVQFTENEISILDGGTGSYFIANGMKHGCCVEEWILDHSSMLLELQRGYVEAGSSIILAPTFGANRIRLESLGKADDIRRLNMEPVKLSKKAAAGKALVSGDISMTGMFLDPDDELAFDQLVDVYKEQAELLAEAGCDLIDIETMISITDAKAALIATRAVTDLPVMVTMSFEKNLRTCFGDEPSESAKILTDLGADAVGANCSTGPVQMKPIIEAMATSTHLPIVAKPNAGLPQPGPNGIIKYDLSEDAFAVEMIKLLECGANILGGCCGTTPPYIRKLTSLSQYMTFKSKSKE